MKLAAKPKPKYFRKRLFFKISVNVLALKNKL
jgi:hypothetical protein